MECLIISDASTMTLTRGTFYNWIKRLRQNSCYEIPERNQVAINNQVSSQEVVKIEVDTACCDIGQRQKEADSCHLLLEM